MSIRIKLIVAFMVAVIISIGSVICLVTWQMRKDALTTYQERAREQLVRINEFIESSFHKNEEITKVLAGSPAIFAAEATLPDYVATTAPTSVPRSEMTPEAVALDKELQRFQEAHPDFATVGVGLENGRYLEYPISTRPTGFDPRTRDWYRTGKAASGDVAITEAYRTVKGILACSISSKIYDGTAFRGLAVVDISLDTMVDRLSNIKIGKTGYVMLVETGGNILADPKHKNLLSKNVSDGVLPGLEKVLSSQSSSFEAAIDGIPRVVSVMTGYSGWKLVAIVDEEEIYAVVDNVIRDIVLVGLGIAVLMLLASLWLARSITLPIDMLVHAAGKIATGDKDALPEERFFSGEMGRLRESLGIMVSNLNQHLETAMNKSREAEEQTEKARVALKEAEEARAAAEKAKRDGMLMAAGQLEDIVAVVSSASEELSAQIEQSERGSSEQAARVAETATAVDEMNSTVLEVARNAGATADISAQTKSKAEYGATVVENVVA
ncbi:MAG: methyl-accepting chemotaxis protein, partial [Bilophila sp.]